MPLAAIFGRCVCFVQPATVCPYGCPTSLLPSQYSPSINCDDFTTTSFFVYHFSVLASFRLPQSLDVQKDLLKQLLSGVLGQWSQNAANIPGPMGPLLTSCASGGLGLFTALGLDQPIENLSSFDSPPVQTRITLTRNILTLMATVRRLAGAVRLDQVSGVGSSSLFLLVRLWG